ncbi:MAG: hypothetical protein U9R32_04710 [Bacteroidota bacterium]|nr:hypothetical protein [Bacteroidota bacterium]
MNKSSAIVRVHGGTFFVSEVIEMDNEYLVYRKGGFFGSEKYSVTIPIKNIVSIELAKTFRCIKIIIKSSGDCEIVGSFFSKKSFDKIKKMIAI